MGKQLEWPRRYDMGQLFFFTYQENDKLDQQNVEPLAQQLPNNLNAAELPIVCKMCTIVSWPQCLNYILKSTLR